MEFRVLASWRVVEPDDDTVVPMGSHLWWVHFAIDARSGNGAPEAMIASSRNCQPSRSNFLFNMVAETPGRAQRVFSCRAAGAG